MKGIICDVGHTIITDSILNSILRQHGKTDAIASLYDESRLAGRDQQAIDDWVTDVSSYKINSLRGLTIENIEQHCRSAKFTPGFSEFVSWAMEQNMAILFIGAVPEIITHALLRSLGIPGTDSHKIQVKGSEVQLVNGLIDRPLKICTPGYKKQYAGQWLLNHGIDVHEFIVIGDSLGDIPTMSLALQDNRYGIHVSSLRLRAMVAREIADFYELPRLIKNKNREMELS